jgi:predicted nucleic acid-binding protein
MKLVLDASVIAKWLFAEIDSDRARNLYDTTRRNKISLIAPQILPAEIASILFVRVLRGLLEVGEANSLYERFGLACPVLHHLLRPWPSDWPFSTDTPSMIASM